VNGIGSCNLLAMSLSTGVRRIQHVNIKWLRFELRIIPIFVGKVYFSLSFSLLVFATFLTFVKNNYVVSDEKFCLKSDIKI
jgi:hypothetical protein